MKNVKNRWGSPFFREWGGGGGQEFTERGITLYHAGGEPPPPSPSPGVVQLAELAGQEFAEKVCKYLGEGEGRLQILQARQWAIWWGEHARYTNTRNKYNLYTVLLDGDFTPLPFNPSPRNEKSS